jgi:hypothetical protein
VIYYDTIYLRPIDRGKSPRDYANAVNSHASRSTENSLFPGQNYERLAKYLQEPYESRVYSNLRDFQPAPKDNEADFATLVDLNPNTRDRVTHLQDVLHFESIMDLQACDDRSGRILFLKGLPSPKWLNSIGSMCQVDPEFFQRHLEFRSTVGRPDYFPYPSLPSSSSNIINLQLTTIGSRETFERSHDQEEVDLLRQDSAKTMDDYLHRLRTRVDCKTGDSIVRRFFIHDETHLSLEQNVSICINKLKKGWIGELKPIPVI